MKLVFASDLIWNKEPSTGSYSTDMRSYLFWEPYLESFDEVLVCSNIPVLHTEAITSPVDKADGLKVSFFPVPSIDGPLSMFTMRIEAIRVLRETLEQGDVLIARLPSEIGLLAVQIARSMNKPWAVEVVGYAGDNCTTLVETIYTPMLKLRVKKAALHAPAALYVTNHFLQSQYPSRGRMFACSDVQIKSINSYVSDMRMDRISSCFEREVFRIGLIGYLSSSSTGIDTALKALRKVQQLTVKTVRLEIIGGGNAARWKQMAEELGIEDLVDFKGAMSSGSSIVQWLDGLDLYIQPSRKAGLARSLVEAMSRGLPAFGSRVGAIPELLGSEHLMDTEDDNHLAMLICNLINDSCKQRRMAERSLEVASTFAIDSLHAKRKAFFDYIKNTAVPPGDSPKFKQG